MGWGFAYVCALLSQFVLSFKFQKSGSPKLCLVTPQSNKFVAFYEVLATPWPLDVRMSSEENLYNHGSNPTELVPFFSSQILSNSVWFWSPYSVPFILCLEVIFIICIKVSLVKAIPPISVFLFYKNYYYLYYH